MQIQSTFSTPRGPLPPSKDSPAIFSHKSRKCHPHAKLTYEIFWQSRASGKTEALPERALLKYDIVNTS